jgi:hypothetical protein
MWFDIVTWPGFLAYAGDMGSFVFTRLEDMFKFFRTDRNNGKLSINPGYWGEKLEAVDSHTHAPGHREYSPEKMKAHIEETVVQWVTEYGLTPQQNSELRQEIGMEILCYLDDGESAVQVALHKFLHRVNGLIFEFEDPWKWDCQQYTFRFLWCCYALSWAIQKYGAIRELDVTTVTKGKV